jgi:hypothetical protein
MFVWRKVTGYIIIDFEALKSGLIKLRISDSTILKEYKYSYREAYLWTRTGDVHFCILKWIREEDIKLLQLHVIYLSLFVTLQNIDTTSIIDELSTKSASI